MAAFVLWEGALLDVEPRRGAQARPPALGSLARWALPRSPARMSPRELRVLPGIGERLALAVADERRRCRAAGSGQALVWEDVRGIGPRTAARVRAWLAAHGLETELVSHAGERPAEKTSAVPSPSSPDPLARTKPW